MVIRRRIEVVRVAGIAVGVHLSWFGVLALVVLAGFRGFAEIFPDAGPVLPAALALVLGIAFFACLTLHELAHALVANRLGVGVRSILLFAFGAVAEIDREARTPGTEFAIALAGPAASVVLAAAAGLASVGPADGRGPLGAVLLALAFLNIGIALFNLLPALPLDGGRILRAGLWRLTADRARATAIAGLGGRGLGALVGLGGLAVAVLGEEPLGLWYVPMGIFLWVVAAAASRRRPPEGVASPHDRHR